MIREAMLFYQSFDKAIDKLEDEDRLSLYRAITKYGLYGEEPELDGAAGAMFELVRPQIDKTAELRGRNEKEYKKWRDAVLKRDGYKCTKCGRGMEYNLQVHHIKPYHEYPDLRLDINNGVTLCADCHREAHRER